jgi:hypothetical protein
MAFSNITSGRQPNPTFSTVLHITGGLGICIREDTGVFSSHYILLHYATLHCIIVISSFQGLAFSLQVGPDITAFLLGLVCFWNNGAWDGHMGSVKRGDLDRRRARFAYQPALVGGFCFY